MMKFTFGRLKERLDNFRPLDLPPLAGGLSG